MIEGRKNQVKKINEAFFKVSSEDVHEVDLLMGDFEKALRSFLLFLIINTIIKETDDKTGMLHELQRNCRPGMVVSFRKLVKREKNNGNYKKGSGTGGDFINELTELEVEDFDEVTSGIDFSRIEAITGLNEVEIRKKFLLLLEKAKKFRDKNYYGRIVEMNEKIELHKDRDERKREKIFEKDERIGEISLKMRVFRDRFQFEPKLMRDCLNEMAEIINLYHKIFWWLGVDLCIKPKKEFRKYIKDWFLMFSAEVAEVKVESMIISLKKELKQSLDLCLWG